MELQVHVTLKKRKLQWIEATSPLSEKKTTIYHLIKTYSNMSAVLKTMFPLPGLILRIIKRLKLIKPTICICENKGADHLCSNCTADQRLCFRYSDSTIPLLLKSEISSF